MRSCTLQTKQLTRYLSIKIFNEIFMPFKTIYCLFIVPLLGCGLLSHGEGLSINHHACSMRVGDFRLHSPGFDLYHVPPCIFILIYEPRQTIGRLKVCSVQALLVDISFDKCFQSCISYILYFKVKMAGLLDFFFNYEADDAITTPKNYPYLIIMRISLSLIKCWPKKTTENLDAGAKFKAKVWGMVQNVLHLAFCVLTIVGTATYVMLHKKNMTFFELGHLYITLMLSCVVFSRLATLTFNEEYQVVANEFLNKIHLFYYKDNSEFSMQTHKQIHRVSHLFTLYVTGQMFGGLSLFNLTPMYNNYSAGKYSKGGLKNSTFDHSLYYSYPFNVSTDVRGYIFSNILHWFFSYIVSTWFCTLDLFLSVIVFHIWGHFKILLHDIDNFPKPTKMVSFKLENTNVTISNENYSTEELEQLADKLKKCIDYHREIISFTNKISEVFGPMLLAYYGFHQASGCLLLLECSQMTPEALARYLPLTLILFQQLIQLSIVFELVGTVSSKLNDAVYGLPWEDMDVKNRKTVAFFLLNVQEPVHVKALGLADVGVTSMTKILKTSMSFFTFLRSI